MPTIVTRLARVLARSILRNTSPGNVDWPRQIQGVFDIYDGFIAGTISGSRRNEEAWVELRTPSSAEPLARTVAERGGEWNTFRFKMPLNEVCTPADLIREHVFVTVRTARGDVGRLAIAGATQMQLIRDHVGETSQEHFNLDFRANGNSMRYRGKGWSNPETWHTWTSGTDSFVNFPTPTDRTGIYLLRLRGSACINDLVPVQEVNVFLNTSLVGAFTINNKDVFFRELKFSGKSFTLEPESQFRLHFPHAFQPSRIPGNKDQRQLAIALQRMSLLRADEDQS